MRKIVTLVCALILALPLLSPFASARAPQRKDKPMPEPYSNASGVLWLIEVADPAAFEKPEPTTPRMFGVFYNPNTDRIVIIGDDDGRKEVPTLGVEERIASTEAVLILDNEGDASTTTDDGSLNPVIELGTYPQGPMGVRWPRFGPGALQPEVGRVVAIKGLIPELVTDGSATQNRAVLQFQDAEVCVAPAVAVNLNSSAVQQLYFNDSGRRFVPTRLVPRDPSISMDDGGTITGSAGSNGAANDAFAARKFLELTGSGLYTLWRPKDGAATVANNDSLDWKLSGAYGVGTVYVDVWGYYL